MKQELKHLIEKIDAWPSGSFVGRSYKLGTNTCIEAISTDELKQLVHLIPEWISVETPPKFFGTYNIRVKDDWMDEAIVIPAFFDRGEMRFLTADHRQADPGKVTHWIPLPQFEEE